jgi:molybdenum cofactor guanylyltransferase
VIPREAITGLVLCGGRGSRMGGLDKGLQLFNGQPLVRTALQRLAPQVGRLMISANRHLDQYAAEGVAVVTDTLPQQPGPLAGLLGGIEHCDTDWLACVPCDAPWFPLDLVARLQMAAQAAPAPALAAVAAVAVSGSAHRIQPVFALVHRDLAARLRDYLASGERRARGWWDSAQAAMAVFEDGPNGRAFHNLNTLDALRALDQITPPAPPDAKRAPPLP